MKNISIFFTGTFTVVFTIIFTITLLVLVSSCGKESPKNYLPQKWEFDTTAYKQHLRETYDKDTKIEQLPITETTINQSTDMLISMKLFLNLDGNAAFTLQGNSSKGKWNFVEDKKQLTLQEDGKTEKISFGIKEVTDEKLVLTVDENIFLFFKKAK